ARIAKRKLLYVVAEHFARGRIDLPRRVELGDEVRARADVLRALTRKHQQQLALGHLTRRTVRRGAAGYAVPSACSSAPERELDGARAPDRGLRPQAGSGSGTASCSRTRLPSASSTGSRSARPTRNSTI